MTEKASYENADHFGQCLALRVGVSRITLYFKFRLLMGDYQSIHAGTVTIPDE